MQSLKKRLNAILQEITLLQVAIVDNAQKSDEERVIQLQQEARALGFNIAMQQIFSNPNKSLVKPHTID